MLARVSWQGDRQNPRDRNPGGWSTEHGTLLAFVHTGSSTRAVIALDGWDVHSRGRIIEKDSSQVKVTTWFKWESGPGSGFPSPSDHLTENT